MFSARFFFNWKTVFGYIVCTLFQMITALCAGVAYISVIVLIIGICLFIIGFASDLDEKFRELNEKLKPIKHKNLNIYERVDIKRKLADIIQFHGETREFSIEHIFCNLN